MYTKIDDNTKRAIWAAQAKALNQLIGSYPNVTATAGAIGVTEMTLRNWAYSDKRASIMSPHMAIKIEEMTAKRGDGKRFRRGRFRPDLFIKGWKP